MMFNSKRITTLAALTALALIMFIVEGLFPPLFIPGAKMGLSNIFSLLALILLSPSQAVILIIIRTTLGSIFSGNISSIIYSLSAGLVAVIASAILYRFVYPKISILAISVVSAVLHNITQSLVFCLITNTPQLFVYMPYLALIGVLAGIIVGVAVQLALKYLPSKMLLQLHEDTIKKVETAQVKTTNNNDMEQK